jgi:glycosyltransferase involved in cell wall biosynthesis
MTLVTIGLPFRNNVSTLRLAIQSVFAQTFDDWELVLLDDGSTDASLSLAESVRDARVRVIADGESRGLAVRLNEITKCARGEYIVRMDADDAMVPTRIETQVEYLASNAQCDVVASPAYLFDVSGTVYGRTGAQPITRERGLFLNGRVIVHPTMAARKSWMAANLYDPSLHRSQDKDLFARTHATTYFAKLPETLLFYREAGQFRLEHYRAQKMLERRIFRRYGPDQVGRTRTLRMIATSAGKELAFRGLDAVGAGQAAYRRSTGRQASSLPCEELSAAQTMLTRVATTVVPGLA